MNLKKLFKNLKKDGISYYCLDFIEIDVLDYV